MVSEGHNVSILMVKRKQYFIFSSASNLNLCLYNQLFARFHYVFKFLTL